MKKLISSLLPCIISAIPIFAQQTVTLSVQVPDATVVCYAVGGFNGWNVSATPMTLKQESPVKIFEAEVVVPDKVEADYNFKFLSGPAWLYEQTDPATDFTFGTAGWSGAVVNAFKDYFTPSPLTDITVSVLVPSSTVECYITGSFCNWETPQRQMTFVESDPDGKFFTYLIEQVDINLLEFKFAAGPGWAYEQTGGNYTYIGSGGNNNEINVTCSEFKAIYDPVNVGDVTIHITSVPVGTDSVYLCGSFGPGWVIAEALAAKNNGDGTFTAVIKQVANFEFKCWSRKNWAYEEAIDQNGTGLTKNRSGSFKETPTMNIEILFWKQVPSSLNQTINGDFSVYTIDRVIYAHNVTGSVRLYTLQGQLIDSFTNKGDYQSVQLRAGVYILSIDGKSRKIMIQ